MDVTHSRTIRAYWRVEMWSRSWKRPGHRNSEPTISGSRIHLASDARVPSEISKRTGFWVLLCRTDARSLIWLDAMTSTTFIFTRSQPRSLLSIARLKRARSRWFSANSSRTLIAQTCFGLSGLFCPTMRPLFQAGRRARMTGKFDVSMTDPPIRHAVPQRQPDVDTATYHEMLRRIRGRL